VRTVAIWAATVAVLIGPLAAAASSPLLAWRDPVYIAAGLAGVVALGLTFVQPMLAGGFLPAVPQRRGRRIHRWVGIGLVAAAALHIAGLWVTSPPDMVDALVFASPTLFSPLGVIAMWALAVAAGLAAWRRRLRLRPQTWRHLHAGVAFVAVLGTVGHVMLIEGTMEPVSKTLLCMCVLAAAGAVLVKLGPSLRRSKLR